MEPGDWILVLPHKMGYWHTVPGTIWQIVPKPSIYPHSPGKIWVSADRPIIPVKFRTEVWDLPKTLVKKINLTKLEKVIHDIKEVT